MKEVSTALLNFIGRAWWVEVSTDHPKCTYFFGPFADEDSARLAQPGYLEDLEKEAAQNIQVSIKRCKPEKLTVYDESVLPFRPVTAVS